MNTKRKIKSKKCFNCKYASKGFKIYGTTYHQCNLPEQIEKIIKNKVSPWDAMRVYYDTCESYSKKEKLWSSK